MDLLNILINPKLSNVCCLCFKKNNDITALHDDIEIHNEYFAISTNLGSILRYLFPFHEFLLTQACGDCSTLILKIFSLFQRSYIKNEMLHCIIEQLNKDIDLKNIDEINIKKYRLSVNLTSFHRIALKKVECQKCPMKFISKSLLKKHIALAHIDTNNAVICDICGKTFTNSIKLKIHLGCHREKSCPYCSKSFKSHSHFNLHLKRHKSYVTVKRKVRYLKCNNCDYQSINKSTLDAHINKFHLNIRPYKCQICQKGFYKRDNLSQHLITHKKVKDNICYICGEDFVIERTLKQHLNLHAGQKPFQCDTCKMCFVTSSRRYEHIKRKHMTKNECCKICNKKFSLKKDLNTHIKKVHTVEEKY